MCGGFVLGQVSERMARLPPERLCESATDQQRIAAALPSGTVDDLCHARGGGSRFGRGAGTARVVRPLSAGLLVLAAMLFLTHALRRIPPSGPDLASSTVRRARWGQLLARLTRRIPRGSGPASSCLESRWVFCRAAFSYAALAAAAASARPAVGAAAMLAFGWGRHRR